MPGHQIPAAARLGGVTSRRHAELLLHSGVVGGESVKDLRLRRVIPPAAGSLDSSPECAAPVKPGSVESTPPEAAPAVAAAAEDLDRKPVLPRSKLVRDPGSFGYRRLLPFLNEMAKNDSSIGKEVPSDNASAHSKHELSRSDSPLVNEPSGVSHCESDAMDSVEPVVLKTGGDPEVQDGCNSVMEEANTVPRELASIKPLLARCTRSRFVHHPSSFSYKRMLPFLMENEISSQESQRIKIQRVAEERVLASDENGISASGQQHLSVSDDSSQECNRAQVERREEEETPKADENRILDDTQFQPAVTKVSPPEYNATEAQIVMQQEVLTSSQDPLTSSEGNLTSDGDVVQTSGQHELVVSEDSPEECKRDEVKRSIPGEAVKSDGSHVLDSTEFQPDVSGVSPPDNSMAQKDAQEPLPSDGDEENPNKGDHLAKGQPQACVTKESTTALLARIRTLLARRMRSRFVHHPSSFSYKRMLPFLMENEISSQESQRIKIRRVAEERVLASDENGISASGQQHLSVSGDSSQECNRAQVERMEEEETPKADENRILDDRQFQPAVTKASPPEYNAAEPQIVMQQEVLTSSQDPLTSSEGKFTSDGDDVQASGQHELVVPEDSPEECKRDEVKRSIQGEAVKSDGSHVLDSREFQPAVSRVSPPDNCMAEVQKAAPGEPLASDGDEENSNKGDHLAKEQPQACVGKESLTAQLQDNAESSEVPQCQKKDSGCHDVGFVSPTKTVIPLLHQHCAQDPEGSVASLGGQLLGGDIQMICRPSNPCAIDRSLSVEEMSGCIPLTESGCKAGMSRPRDAHSIEKTDQSPKKISPKKLSPKKGILKRHTRGCKGICMCLDCSMFRLRADRAFEFSRKQMQEADDIISNLLKEVANLRSLVEKPTGQESTQAACRRASRVEKVARERCRQMFVDLNSHCRIPGLRVRFAQYVEEKKPSSSPRSSSRR